MKKKKKKLRKIELPKLGGGDSPCLGPDSLKIQDYALYITWPPIELRVYIPPPQSKYWGLVVSNNQDAADNLQVN
jgi:hypothetical protein